MIDLFNEKKYTICLKSESDTYLNFLSPIAKNIFDEYHLQPWPIKEYHGEKLFQGLLYSTIEDRKLLEKQLSDIKFTSWSSMATDMIPIDGGKPKGIEKYLEHTNTKLEETMAFGDGENDVDMLEYVNIGVAMGNANDVVKNSANYVTDDCDKEGIYKALVHFGIL